MKNKINTEYSGIESYVWDSFKKNNTDWIPQQIALSFQGKEKLEETQIAEAIATAQEQMKNLQQEIKSIKSMLLTEDSKYFSI